MMSWKRWLAVLVFVVAYLLFGGAVFMALESPAEVDRHREIRELRTQIYEAFVWNNVSLGHEGRKELLKRLVSRSDIGCLIGPEDPPLRWNMFNSFFFAVTVTTTIGYGHMAPSTSTGRVFCIIFALIGIPVNGILLASLGDYFGAKLYKRSQHRLKEKRRRTKMEFILCVLLYLIPGILIFLLLPAGLFVLAEGWDYLDALYFSFVSLTTIGFGDFVAGQTEGKNWLWIYRTTLVLWIVFGLGFLVMVINVITRGLKSKPVKKLEKKILNTTRLADAKKLRALINEIAVMSVKPVYRHDTAKKKSQIMRTASQPFLSENMIPQSSDTEENEHQRVPPVRRASDTVLNDIDRGATFAQHNVPPKQSEGVQIPEDDEEDPVRLLARLANHLVANEENTDMSDGDYSDSQSDDGDTSWENEEEIFQMEEDEENVVQATSEKLTRRRFFRFTSVFKEDETGSVAHSLPPRGVDKDEVDLGQETDSRCDEDPASQQSTIVAGCCSAEPLFGSMQAWIGTRNSNKPVDNQFLCPSATNTNVKVHKKTLQREESVSSNIFRNPVAIFGSLMRRQPPQAQPAQPSEPIMVNTGGGRLACNELSVSSSWNERLSLSSTQLNEIGRQMVINSHVVTANGSRSFCSRHHGAPCPRTTAAELAQLLNAVRETRRLQQRKISQNDSQCGSNCQKS